MARPRKTAAVERPKIDKYLPYSKLPIEGLPPEPLEQYGGKAELEGSEYPHYFVELTAPQFIYMWRMAEAKAYQHWSSDHMQKTLPSQVTVSLGTAQAFRLAAGTVTTRLKAIGSKSRKFTRR